MRATQRQRTLRRRGGTPNPAPTPTPASQQVIMAILAGQSNSVGRNTQDGLDADMADVFQFGGDGAQGDYRTLASDITPLDHPDQLDRVGPGINLLGD